MNDFCVFILTHGRPNVITYKTLQTCGYTGLVYLVVDDEDSTVDQYKRVYGDKVLVFSKKEVAKTFDEGDNFENRKVIVYARNVCFRLAQEVGVRYFIELDDDYHGFAFKVLFQDGRMLERKIENLDKVFEILLEYFK